MEENKTIIDARCLSRKALRDMEEGRTYVYRLPSAAACDSAKTMAYHMQHLLGCRFTARTNYGERTVTLVRHAIEKEGGGQ